ncbi:proline dehydrogenase, partial [Cooperia oncophora]
LFFRTYFYEGEEVCDRNRDIFKETVDAVAKVTQGEGFAAIKVTALGRPTLLLKLSESIAQTHNFFKTLTGTQKIQFSRLSEEDLVKKLQASLFKNMVRRLIDIAEHSINKGSFIHFRYNRERGNIFNTYQAYLRNALDCLECDMQLAEREKDGIFVLKLERKRAATIGYPDPINPDFEATTNMYHACLKRVAEENVRRGKGAVSVMIASHNEDSVRFAVNLMKDHGIAPSERIMCFAQLYGMCD